MNEEQRFAFDTWGFLVVEDALSPGQVQALKATVDERGPDLHSQHAEFLEVPLRIERPEVAVLKAFS